MAEIDDVVDALQRCNPNIEPAALYEMVRVDPDDLGDQELADRIGLEHRPHPRHSGLDPESRA